MTPVDQEFLKERGEIGDCWRACIATLLDLPIADVPHIVLQAYLEAGVPAEHIYDVAASEGGPSIEWWPATQRFARRHGFEAELVHPAAGCGWSDVFNSLLKEGVRYVIFSGRSARGVNHCVVWGLERDELAHDPHPSRLGVAEPYLDACYFTKISE